MRDRIKAVATDLYIRRGYRGFSFGDISAVIGTTRANIHYHFGNKRSLIEEVVEDYVDDVLERFGVIWTDPGTSLRGKIAAQIESNRRRYLTYNAADGSRNFWSLIARLRHDGDALGELAFRNLERFNEELRGHLRVGFDLAVAERELDPDTPVDEIALQILAIISLAGPITQDFGNFEQVERLYLSFADLLEAAHGRPAAMPQAALAPSLAAVEA